VTRDPVQDAVIDGGVGDTLLPLSGIRVVELSLWVQAPVAGFALADQGADVIKIEPAEGDPSRNTVTSFGVPSVFPSGQPALFAVGNQGKRSVVLNLKTAAARPDLLSAMGCTLSGHRAR
jgi:crotonobetainyl-CoA:carnitine CoA-transferase CaiB-like acyl-CoA transferase